MAFTPTVYFAIAHTAGAVRRIVAPQLSPAVVTVSAPYSGAPGGGTVLGVSFSTLSGSGTNTAHEGFKLVWTTSLGGDQTCEFSLDPVGFANLSLSIRNAIVNAFETGGRLVLDVERPGNPAVVDKLAVELRRIQTGDYIVNETGTTASPAHYPGVAGGATNLPVGTGTFTYRVSELGGAADLAINATGALTITQPAAPAQPFNRVLTVRSSINGVADGDGGTANLSNVVSTLPVDLHLSTQCILLLDRSGSMGAPATASTTKWDEALAAANLFATLYGDGLPPLSTANVGLSSIHSLAFGRFRTQPSFDAQYLPAAGFNPATPVVNLPAETPGGGTPIGQALTDALSRFTVGTWKRRHLILLSDGMSNVGTPTFSDVFDFPSTHLPSVADNANTGIKAHAISYTVAGETSAEVLSTFVNHYGGAFHGTGAELIDLDPNALREMFLTVLSDVIPVERAEIPGGSTTVEDGLDRAIFVTTGASISAAHSNAATAALPGGSTTTTGSANGYAWAIVDQPLDGLWNVTAPAGAQKFSLFDVALRMRCTVEEQGLGKPIRLTAQVHHKGTPVSGAEIFVAVQRPGESVGALTTNFVRSGGLVTAVRIGVVTTGVVTLGVLDTTAVSSRRDVPVAAQPTEADVSLRGTLLDAAEEARNLRLQILGNSIQLRETEPGVYVAEVDASLTAEEGLYSFRFRGRGHTPAGKPFVRDSRISKALLPVPDPRRSETTVARSAVVAGTATYTLTALPVTATGRPLGPALGGHLVFQYADSAVRKELPPIVTIDRLDGTYAAQIVLDEKRALPPVALYYLPAGPKAAPLVIRDQHAARRVKVTLDKIQVLDDKDPCFMGKGELEFDAIVAPNSNPHRAVRTRIPRVGTLELASGSAKEVHQVIFEGLVEQDATLSVTVGGKELDWLLFFEREEELARYHRTLKLEPGKHTLSPDDEKNDPEALADWKLWYTVEVS